MKLRAFLGAVLALAPAAFGQSAVDGRAVARALAFFQEHARDYDLTDAGQDLSAARGRQDADGTWHIRLEQRFRGIPVFEGQAVAHVRPDSRVSVTDALARGLNVDIRPAITANAARERVIQMLGLPADADVQLNRLEILPKGARSGETALVHHVRVYSESALTDPVQYDAFVDAKTGVVRWAFNSLETAGAVGTGRTMYSGVVSLQTATSTTDGFSLTDTTRANNYTVDMNNRQFGRGTLVTDSANDFGDGSKSNSDRDTAAADAHYGMGVTWDYYQATFGRNGIDGTGRTAYSRVHFGRRYENANWSDSCFCMTYGDGGSTFYPLVALDVAGHEMTHGVTASEAGLTYSGESGGLNESTSDIFGTLVEFHAANAQDVPDYWIGERMYKTNYSNGGSTYTQTSALRYMDDPNKDGISPACWSSTLGNLNVHYSSGPSNHMFYLLSHGGVSKCNGNNVVGLGNDKAGAIWYRALTTYMTSSTNYKQALGAAQSAATDLYGAGSTEYNTVTAAFAAINVVP